VIEIVAEDPSELDNCGFEDGPYPISEDKIPVLKQMIMQRELGVRPYMASDL